MESSYGIGVKNRYELFYDDEEDPTELLRQQEEEKERRKAEKTTAKDKSKGPVPVKGVKAPVNAAGKKQIKEAPVNKSQERTIAPRDDNKLQRTTRPADRAVKFAPPSGGGRENQQDFEERKNRRNREERISTGGTEARFDFGSRDRGDGEVRRGGRGGGLGGRGGYPRRGRGGFAPEGGRGGGFGGRGGGYDGRGKREFERQSGSDRSGVKPVDKKGGEGSYNWGTVNDDLEVQLSPFGDENTTEAAEKSGDETAAGENTADTSKDSGVAGEEGAASENAAEDTKEMTLDEYKREQEQKRSRASFNIRKPGEGGEEKAEWKKMYVLKKKITDEDGEEEEEEESEDEDEYMRRGRQRQVVDIEINFADQRRGRGGRGGRGMGRGGPGRGSFGGPRGPPREGGERPPRGGYRGGGAGAGAGGEPPKQSAPKVDDWNDFPSLVAA
ncbi:plasminogen activator inhibitor 1 RNA-binding protein isoform X1 [Rhipicephalus sanguineus]|uniref:plasminogen activator inhibitor 1 RNA-binding protein isoform X1 n=1 Tax=Rhipicephalus sanguineus TaxID=34632 RepID=UPI0018950AE5|nr:plasminogen activator inhibitor 1 RNA-binding protein isoform X1 [Rhipicephalus sanguineus]